LRSPVSVAYLFSFSNPCVKNFMRTKENKMGLNC
jgi:hypothetical protein